MLADYEADLSARKLAERGGAATGMRLCARACDIRLGLGLGQRGLGSDSSRAGAGVGAEGAAGEGVRTTPGPMAAGGCRADRLRTAGCQTATTQRCARVAGSSSASRSVQTASSPRGFRFRRFDHRSSSLAFNRCTGFSFASAKETASVRFACCRLWLWLPLMYGLFTPVFNSNTSQRKEILFNSYWGAFVQPLSRSISTNESFR
ncbi:hypothetical protein BC830DRAFT_868979 [Chytriomyces sp. MP71]|nr:hypothetical protein BC830DRAFT_868979 [Chytriomyces sp. MP71]